jgi:hypothetical protein
MGDSTAQNNCMEHFTAEEIANEGAAAAKEARVLQTLNGRAD